MLKSSQQQGATVSGTIEDNDGIPVIGATVVDKSNPSHGTVTDIDGNFTLTGLSDNAVLQISYVGMVTQEVALNGRKSIEVVLESDSELLDEVVVVGYGVQKKENLTGSVSVVNGQDLELRPVTDAAQSLQGLVPGLFVNNSSAGRPGASATLSLRGQGNLSGSSNPYILVDGVEMSLSDVNPSDIENISVLKDAAASSIYGARAAYGVILVTTKKGEDGKMRVNYRGNVGWSAPTVLPDMVDSYTFAQYWNDGIRNAGATRLYSEEKLSMLQKYINDPSSVDPWFELSPNASLNPAFENTELGVGNVNYFDLHFKDNSFKQNHNISFSGGNKLAQYYISGGYLNENGILRFADMNYDRYNFSANISSQVNDWLNLKANTKYVHSENDTPFGDGGLSEGFYHSLARFSPTKNEIDPNGNYTELSLVPYLQSGTYTNTQRDNLNLTLGVEIEPLKNWMIYANYTYSLNNVEYEALNKSPLIFAADGVTTSPGARGEMGVSPDGSFTRRYNNNRYQTINVFTNYSFSLRNSHNFTVMAGYQEDDSDYSYLRNMTTGLYSTTNPNVAMGSGTNSITDNRSGWATRGYFGRLNYDYKEKYLLEFNGRYDGSSRFAKDNRWGFFPSISAGWNILREDFMTDATRILSILKLRASYGQLGNQAGAGLYTFASTMSLSGGLGSYIFSDGRHTYINAPGVIDPFTTWEKVTSNNIGIDFGFSGNSLTGSFDVFQRETRDMMGPGEDYPDFFGASAPQTNNASMRNKGWELALNYRGKIGSEIDYSVSGYLSDAISEVTQYANPTGTNPSGNWYVGKRVGEIWGYRSSGLIQTQKEADEYNEKYNLSFISGRPWSPGDVKFIDLNGDNAINNGSNNLSDTGDMTIIGNTTPRYQYTLNGNISWKGLSLSMMFQGVGKRDWHPGKAVYFWGSGPYAQVTVFKEHLDYWSESNPNAYYPKPYIHSAGGVVPYNNKTMTTSDRYLQNAAYCRLKNLTLSYDIPSSLLNNIGISKLQVYFSGENLATLTSLKTMFDPEAIFTGNSYTSEGGKNYPMNRVLSVGAVINL
ncbi:MAG: TonB-dependent receptor [Fermentimonas sp.]|nr:TonB-dependent receptor [Fermentimonas sp.]